MFPEKIQFHISEYINNFVNWLTTNWGEQFNTFSNMLLKLIIVIKDILLFIPWWAWVALIAVTYWLITKRILNALALAILFTTIGVFGLWAEAMDTMAVVIVSVLFAIVLGIPMGILMAESKRANMIVTPLLDAMQTMPSFVYLIPAMMLFNLGKVPAVMATVIYALAPVVRLTNLGIRQVSESVQEAAYAFGATPWQMMREVKLPLAMPSILTGVNQTTMMALSMVVVASMIGAGGLGEKVLLSINRIDVGNGFEAGLAVVAMAIVMDRLTQGMAKRWQPPTK